MVGGKRVSAETLASIREKYGLLGDPVSEYVKWVGKAVQGDLGESYRQKQTVTDMILDRLPITLWLVIMATIIAIVTLCSASTTDGGAMFDIGASGIPTSERGQGPSATKSSGDVASGIVVTR